MTNNIEPSTVDTLAELMAKQQELLRRRNAPRIMCEDVTGEKMTSLLEAHGETMASVSADARSAVKILLGKYVSSGTDEDPYLKGWSGDSTRQDRMGRASTALDAPVLSVTWAIQPDLFNKAFNHETLAESGLIPRFICCRVEPELVSPSYDEQSAASEAQLRYQRLIRTLLATYRQISTATYDISAEPAAREVFGNYQKEIHSKIQNGEFSDIRTFAMRWAEIAWKIALILHCAEYAETAHTKQLSSSTAADAVAIMKWFATHQRELLGETAKAVSGTKASVALTFVNSAAGGVTARDLQRHKQTLFRKVSDAREVLEQLEHEAAITSELVRSTRRYFRQRPRR
jgi:hypothetical protein